MNDSITHVIELGIYSPAEAHRIATERTEFVVPDARCTIVTEITKATCTTDFQGKTWRFEVMAVIK